MKTIYALSAHRHIHLQAHHHALSAQIYKKDWNMIFPLEVAAKYVGTILP